jgi:hypothetical protein
MKKVKIPIKSKNCFITGKKTLKFIGFLIQRGRINKNRLEKLSLLPSRLKTALPEIPQNRRDQNSVR